MTQNELAKMSDEEKIRAVAEKIMGWERFAPKEFWVDAQHTESRYVGKGWGYWNPLGNTNARDEVVEAMRQRRVPLIVHIRPWSGKDYCAVVTEPNVVRIGTAYANTPGEAAVDACLLAIGDNDK